MMSIRAAIENTVPLSLFNKGLAGKIFEEVKQCGAKVVMKNNAAECVLLSPEEYVKMVDEINDARLLTLATERMSNYDPETVVSEEEMNREFPITQEQLDAVGEIDFE